MKNYKTKKFLLSTSKTYDTKKKKISGYFPEIFWSCSWLVILSRLWGYKWFWVEASTGGVSLSTPSQHVCPLESTLEFSPICAEAFPLDDPGEQHSAIISLDTTEWVSESDNVVKYVPSLAAEKVEDWLESVITISFQWFFWINNVNHYNSTELQPITIFGEGEE